MTQTTKFKGVFFLEKNRLQIYSEGKPSILAFDLPPAIVHDIEIFNRIELEKQLNAFIKTNALPPTEYIMVLSQNILFEKDFAPAVPDEEKKFLDSVPFEYVSTKQFPNEKGVHVVVANSDFFSTFKDIFDQNGSSTLAVIPYFAVSAQMNGLDQGSVTTILNQFHQLPQHNLSTTQQSEFATVPTEQEKKQSGSKKQNKSQLFILVGVFVGLIGVLIIVLLRSGGSPKPSPVANAVSGGISANPVVPTLATATGEASQTPQPIVGKDTVVIQVRYDTSQAPQAQTVKNQLLQDGYLNVQLADGGTINSPKPVMIISTKLSQDLRIDLLNRVRIVLPDVVSQESDNTTSDVVITIGR